MLLGQFLVLGIVLLKFNIDKKYQVIIPDRKDSQKDPAVRADMNWYINSLETEYGQKLVFMEEGAERSSCKASSQWCSKLR